ncbi:MAG: signal peptidase II [Synergistaceae bacterium]|jgi:signal peptidase II|nr:signal peptidase II [Synergistaceae bacterium]
MLVKNKTITFVLALTADIATKYWALSVLAVASEKMTFSTLLSLRLRFNQGISFSLLVRHPRGAWLVAVVSVVFLGMLCVKNATVRSSSGMSFGMFFGMSLLWAGGLGNLADRVFYGYVVD